MKSIFLSKLFLMGLIAIPLATSHLTKAMDEKNAKILLEEFLDLSKNPQKNFEQYITDLIAILKPNPKYKDACTKLEAIKTNKKYTAVSTQLLKLKSELPESLASLIKAQGTGTLLKILQARVSSPGLAKNKNKAAAKDPIKEATRLIQEFLDITNNPQKNFEKYIEDLIGILESHAQYKDLCVKLKEIKVIKSHTSVSTKLLKLKSDLPTSISDLLSQKGAGQLLKVLKARVK